MSHATALVNLPDDELVPTDENLIEFAARLVDFRNFRIAIQRKLDLGQPCHRNRRDAPVRAIAVVIGGIMAPPNNPTRWASQVKGS